MDVIYFNALQYYRGITHHVLLEMFIDSLARRKACVLYSKYRDCCIDCTNRSLFESSGQCWIQGVARMDISPPEKNWDFVFTTVKKWNLSPEPQKSFQDNSMWIQYWLCRIVLELRGETPCWSGGLAAVMHYLEEVVITIWMVSLSMCISHNLLRRVTICCTKASLMDVWIMVGCGMSSFKEACRLSMMTCLSLRDRAMFTSLVIWPLSPLNVERYRVRCYSAPQCNFSLQDYSFVMSVRRRSHHAMLLLIRCVVSPYQIIMITAVQTHNDGIDSPLLWVQRVGENWASPFYKHDVKKW